MTPEERAQLAAVPALNVDTALLEQVAGVVDVILEARRAALAAVVDNPAQQEAFVKHGVDDMRERMLEAGVDPEAVGPDGVKISESLSLQNAAATVGAIRAHLMGTGGAVPEPLPEPTGPPAPAPPLPLI